MGEHSCFLIDHQQVIILENHAEREAGFPLRPSIATGAGKGGILLEGGVGELLPDANPLRGIDADAVQTHRPLPQEPVQGRERQEGQVFAQHPVKAASVIVDADRNRHVIHLPNLCVPAGAVNGSTPGNRFGLDKRCPVRGC
jgi:hypothetical protein